MTSFLVVKLPPGADVSDLVNQAADENLLFSLCDTPTDVIKLIDDSVVSESAAEEETPEVKIEPLDVDSGPLALTPGQENLLNRLSFPGQPSNSKIPDSVLCLPASVVNAFYPSPAVASTPSLKRQRIREFKCPVCEMPLTSQGLASHLRSHPSLTLDFGAGPDDGRDLPHHCTKCSRRFETHEKLRMHDALHVKTKQTCFKCGFKALSSMKLNSHILNAHGEEAESDVRKRAKLKELIEFGAAATAPKIESTEELVIREGRVTYEVGPTSTAGYEGGGEEESVIKLEIDDGYEEDKTPDSMETFITLSSTSEDDQFVFDYNPMNDASTQQPQELQKSTH